MDLKRFIPTRRNEMGLSSEERYSYICHSIDRIVEEAKEIKGREGFNISEDDNELLQMIDMLWPTFLGHKGNGLFWIFGGATESNVMAENSPVGIAFTSHVPEQPNDLISEVQKEYNSKAVISSMLEMSVLIDDFPHNHILRIFSDIEQIEYALFRYDDDFVEQYDQLGILVRQIQGWFFHEFKDNGIYSKTWMVKHLVDKCYISYADDMVTKWFEDNNMHHDMRVRRDLSFDELFHLYRKHQFSKGLSLGERLSIILFLAGRRFHYPHQHADLIKRIQEHNKQKRVEKIDIKLIQEALKKCAGASAQYKEDEKEDRYQSCVFTGNVSNGGKTSNYQWENYDKGATENA
jgi:hypothetical protein